VLTSKNTENGVFSNSECGINFTADFNQLYANRPITSLKESQSVTGFCFYAITNSE
jgi:hypothetical protein